MLLHKGALEARPTFPSLTVRRCWGRLFSTLSLLGLLAALAPVANALPIPEGAADYPSNINSMPAHSYSKRYDVAIVTRLPGRPHPLRVLASILASAAATGALNDARRVYVVINAHYEAENPLHNNNLLRNLNVGHTSVHFLPAHYHPQQATGLLYAMELYLRHNGGASHGLLALEDDIVFAPDFASHLAEALSQSDNLAVQERRLPRPYLLLMYRNNDGTLLEEGDGYTDVADKVKDLVKAHKIERMEYEAWSKVQVFKRDPGFVGALAVYATTNYIVHCLEWCHANKSLPIDLRTPNVSLPLGKIGIGADILLSEFNKAYAEDAIVVNTANHLVQHVGVTSARRLINNNWPQNKFPRSKLFPYVEGYVTLDEDEWW